jgi:hypothetical protein
LFEFFIVLILFLKLSFKSKAWTIGHGQVIFNKYFNYADWRIG